jgi:RHS repeat-associated protein
LRAQAAPKRPFDSGGSDTPWSPAAVYTWGAAGLVSEWRMNLPCAGGNPGSLFYAYFPDGTTGALTDINGTVQDVYLDSAYGEQWGYMGWGDPNPFQYGGQFGYYSDPLNIVSLVLCGQRWYVPNAGFWLSRDPAGYAGGDNLYRYCDDNPLGWVDPSGMVVTILRDPSDPNAITLLLPVKFYHEGGEFPMSDAEVAAAISARWTGTFGKYRVTTRVINADELWNGLLPVGPDWDKLTNFIFLSGKPGRSFCRPRGSGCAKFGDWYARRGGGPWQLVDLRNVMSHESGHLMGLGDGYVEGTWLPKPGWDPRDIMVRSSGDVIESDIANIVSDETNHRDILYSQP